MENDFKNNEFMNNKSSISGLNKELEVSALSNQASSESKDKNSYIDGEGLIYKICGVDSQYIELVLRPGDSIVGDEKNMLYYDKGIESALKINADTNPAKGFVGKFMNFGAATLSGRRFFLSSYTNKSNSPRKLAFSPSVNGKIVVLNISKLGGSFLCKKAAFLCGGKDVYLDFANRSEKGAGVIFGGLEMEKIAGKGLVAFFVSGNVLQKKLAAGQILYLNQGATVARESSVELKVNKKVDRSTMGEYKLTEVLKGPGYVWLQSVPENRLRNDITKRTTQILSKLNKNKSNE
jgi:uncharacterized protein (AIM24 family)